MFRSLAGHLYKSGFLSQRRSVGHLSLRSLSVDPALITYSPDHLPADYKDYALVSPEHRKSYRFRDPKSGKVVSLSHAQSLHSKTPLIEDNIGTWFNGQVSKYGDNELLRVVYQDVRWSWADLQDRVDRFCTTLLNMGYEKGDRLGVWLPNSAEWVIAQFATAKTGIILVNINPAYRISELSNAINQVGLKGLILVPQHLKSDYVNMMYELIPELKTLPASPASISSPQLPTLKHIIHIGSEAIPGMIRFSDLIASPLQPDDRLSLNKLTASLVNTDPINIQFTSGTTGLPKGATLTHRNILNNGSFIGEKLRLTPQDKMCVPVPLYHCFGLVLSNLASMTQGASLVYASAHFDTIKVLQAVQEEKCTALQGVPSMFIAELNHPRFKEFDLSTLRTGIMAGSVCPVEVMKRVINEMNMKEVTICYGMTETSPVSFQTELDDPIERRVETVGRVHDYQEVKIVDEQGRTVPCGTPGELWVKGYNVMNGYWNDAKKTEEILQDGWCKTGDTVVMDEEGYARIVGRTKDCIIRGGENIYPREIEEYLLKHPLIQEAHVVGVPDAKYGEQVCVWVKLKPIDSEHVISPFEPNLFSSPHFDLAPHPTFTGEQLREFCRGQIAHYKIPHYVIFVSKFPQTITGKIQKFIMKDESVRLLKALGQLQE